MINRILKISPRGLSLIKAFEGFSAKPYFCPAGYLTIGYGHVIQDGESFKAPLSENEATQLLLADVVSAEQSVARLIDVSLTQHQYDSLVSFTFNLGGGALQRSSLRRKVNRQDHEGAADEFIKWVWARGRKLSGLIKRRTAERNLYRLSCA